MKKYIALFGFALAACTNGQGEVDVTSVDVAEFPPPPPSASAGQLVGQTVTTDASLSVDVHKDLESLSNLGSLSGTISKETVSGPDLSLIHHIQATIGAADGSMDERVLCDVDVPQDSAAFDIPRSISDGLLFEYLTEGKVTIHLAITGTLPDRQLSLSHTLVAHMNVAMQGSVTKF